VNKLLAPLKSNLRSYILLTGATGLLGQYLLRDLLLSDHQVAVLARPNKRQSVEKRIESILLRFESELKRSLPRPVILEGDVSEAELNLNKRQIQWIASHCNSILHNAATLQFYGSSRAEEPWRTNLGGTQNILQLARRAEIEHLHHVSTAYVCGQRTGIVMESDFDCGQDFRNDYEKSKFAAEQLVRNAEHLKTATIYRPVVIGGDSKTGYTSTYHGLFLYLRLNATLVPLQRRNEQGLCETPMKIPLDGDEPRNLVPVDWVSQVMMHLFNTPAAHGQTFHLSPDHRITPQEFIDYCCEYFHSFGVEFIGRGADRLCDSDFAARFYENIKIYQAYETNDPLFDKTNLLKYAAHLPCPRIDKETIFRYIKFGQANAWGKKRYVAVASENSLSRMIEIPV
jgi:thioester reductase-like protein